MKTIQALLVAIVALLAALVLLSLPEIRRYLKLRSM
jgi:hypothetical protein